MKKSRHPLLRNNVRQLAWLIIGFVITIALLESKGFVVWANQKEVSSAQQRLLAATQTVDQGLSAVAAPVTEIRPKALEFLSQRGWADTPADNLEEPQTVATPKEVAKNTSSVDVKDVLSESSHSTDGVLTGVIIQGVQPKVEPSDAGTETEGIKDTKETKDTKDIKDTKDTKDSEPVLQTPEGKTETPQAEKTENQNTTVMPDKADAPDHANTGSTTPSVQVSARLPVFQPGADMKLKPLPLAQSKAPRRVALAGDSMMAVGLSGQLRRDLAEYKDSIVTVNAFRSATGLARPEVFDWQKKYPAMVSNDPPDVVIVAIGGNDTQNLAVNKKVLAIGSEEWREEYGKRIEEYLNMLTKDGAVVLWIKLPPMNNKSKKYNESAVVVNEVAYSVVSKNSSAIWWDPWVRYLNDNGKFQEFGVVAEGGKPVRLRQEDGTHLTDNGAKLLTVDIVQWLNPAPIETQAEQMQAKPQIQPEDQETENKTQGKTEDKTENKTEDKVENKIENPANTIAGQPPVHAVQAENVTLPAKLAEPQTPVAKP